MDRRTFLKTTTAAAAVSTASGAAQAGASSEAAAIIKSRQELRISVPTETHFKSAAEIFAKEIEVASDGRIMMVLVDISGSSTTALQQDHLDGAFGHLPDLLAAPELSLFAGLPGDIALQPGAFLTWLHAGAGDLFLEEAASDFDVAALTVGHSGAATGLWSSQRLSDPNDLTTAKAQTIGLGNRLIDGMRAAIAPPQSDGPAAELIETATQPIDAFTDLPESARSIWYRDGLHQQGMAASFVLSLPAWHNKLTPGDQLLLRTFAFAAAQHDLAGVTVNKNLVAPAIMASLPIEVQSLPANISSAVRESALRTTHDVIARNIVTVRAFQAYAAFFEDTTGSPLPRPSEASDPVIS